MLPLRNKLEWLATAPTPASGGASAMLAATEMVTSESNGDHLDVDVFSEEIEYFTTWVNQNNPATFWGMLYEGLDS